MCGFLGILLWWTKAEPLIVIASGVVLLLIYDFVLTLMYGERGARKLSGTALGIVQMLSGVYMSAFGLLTLWLTYEVARAAGVGRYIVPIGTIVLGGGLVLLGLWNLIWRRERPAGSRTG